MIRIASRPKPAAPAWHEGSSPTLAFHPPARPHSLPPPWPRGPRGGHPRCHLQRFRGLARLAELGKLDLAYATPLALFGIRQVKDGRMTGGHLNCRDVMSPYCRKLKGITVERLDKYDETEECWQEILIPDQTCTPAELAASRIDVPAWLTTLKPRDRRIRRFLGIGNGTERCGREVRHERRPREPAPTRITAIVEPFLWPGRCDGCRFRRRSSGRETLKLY